MHKQSNSDVTSVKWNRLYCRCVVFLKYTAEKKHKNKLLKNKYKTNDPLWMFPSPVSDLSFGLVTLVANGGGRGWRWVSNQGHFLSTHCFPPSSYSCLEIHICWKVPWWTNRCGMMMEACWKCCSNVLQLLAFACPYEWCQDGASYPGAESALHRGVVGYQLKSHALKVTHMFNSGQSSVTWSDDNMLRLDTHSPEGFSVRVLC